MINSTRETRDLTKRQFDAACARRGFKASGFMGYYEIGHGTSVSVLNAGDNRRARLAYLIRECAKVEKRCEREGCVDHRKDPQS
jgi:hypothetical protein